MQQQLSSESVAKVVNDITEDVSLSVWISFAKIYNESVYDLLISKLQPRQKLQLGQCHDNAYIKDLTYINVRSGLEAYQILQYGLHNLQRAATSINVHSSRSHSIFTIMLVQASDDKKCYSISAFNFCDLAGSERIKKTYVRNRLIESKNINTSLMVLGRCFCIIRQCQKEKAANKQIPFRDSKLTRLFQRALLGHEQIFMVVNINTTRNMFDESHHVLNFSAIAKDVTIAEQQLVRPLLCNRFLGYVQQQSSVIHPITEEEDRHILDSLLLRISEITLQLEKQKLEAKEDRDYLLKETTEFWENRCRALEERVTQSRRALMRASNEEASSSVICLDSSFSSDEENMNSSFTKAHNQVAKLTKELQEKEEFVNNLTEENATLKQTLDDGIKMYKELVVQSQSTIQQLQKQLVLQEDQISVLQNQLIVIVRFGD